MDAPDFAESNGTIRQLTARELVRSEFDLDGNDIIGNGLLKRRSILFLCGWSKTCKSYLTLGLLMDVLAGTPLYGISRLDKHSRPQYVFPTNRAGRRVLYIEKEIGWIDLQERVLNLLEFYTPDQRERILDGLTIVSEDYTIRLDTEAGRGAFSELIAAVRPTIIALDPLKEFYVGYDENSSADMSRLFVEIDRMRQEEGLTFILVHHEGKDDNRGSRGGEQRMRGSSYLSGKYDSLISVRRPNARHKTELELEFTLRRGRPVDDVLIKIDNDGCMMPRFAGWAGQKQSSGKSRRTSQEPKS